MTTNHNIKIPEQHYVTLQGREKNVPIGFLTPFGTNAAAKKRMATADDWAKDWNRTKLEIEAKTVDNVLMTGFKIAHSVSRYSTSNVVWRILDPRGFELEISSPNMSDLIGVTTIENGEIQERCIWARQGANNVLLAENDPEYIQAKTNSERVEKKVSLRDLEIGNTVVLFNGTIGQYMGCFHFLSLSYGSYNRSGYGGDNEDSPSKVEMAKTPKHFFYIKGTPGKRNSGPSCLGVSSPKISEITDSKTVLDIKDTEEMINTKFAAGELRIESASGSEYRAIGLVARTKETVNMKVKLNHLADPQAFVNAREKVAKDMDIYWHGLALIAEHDGNWIDCETGIFKPSQPGYSPSRSDLVRGNRIYLQSLRNDLTLIHKDNTTYGEKSLSSGYYGNRPNIEETLIADCKWHLPVLTYRSPVTENSFEMPLP